MIFFLPLSHHIDLIVPAGLVRHLLGPFLVHISSSLRLLRGTSSKGGSLSLSPLGPNTPVELNAIDAPHPSFKYS